MTPHGPAIILKGISFSYGPERPAFMQRISLKIPGTAVTAILGPNGSGKTTMLHLLLGRLVPHEGELLVEGRPRSRIPKRDLRRLIGLVPQEETIPFDLSVLEYVLLGRAPHLGLLEVPGEQDRWVACQALDTAGLGALENRPVTSLSGGERQLATIARALAQETAILLLDEPTSHLDLANTRKVLKVMQLLGARGKTVVFTTHDPNAAAAVADHMILLRGGEVIATAPLQEAFTPELLSLTYGMEVEVLRIGNRSLVLSF